MRSAASPTCRAPRSLERHLELAFYGSAYFSTMDIFGGGHLDQIFKWVCGLGVVDPVNAASLIR